TGNVDEEIGRRLIHLFLELNRLGTTVFIATHDKTIVEQVKAPVLYIQNGQLSLARKGGRIH
ncbi:MAG: cell division ATP-binding protein FtsE, partial [Alphaproteobacteria bacterium]